MVKGHNDQQQLLRQRSLGGQRPTRRSGGGQLYFLIRFILFVGLCFAIALVRLMPDTELVQLIDTPYLSLKGSHKTSAAAASIIPFDLSVNHLQLISLAGGALPEQAAGVSEDFLPIIAGGFPELRFRLKASVGAAPSALRDIRAYQIEAEHAHATFPLWDSGKVKVTDGMPHSISWGGGQLAVGTIVRWRVSVWDSKGIGPSTSDWTKFGVGPSDDQWKGKWITHPADKFSPAFHTRAGTTTKEECDEWKARRPLPVARAKVELSKQGAGKDVVSALLVVSGLGSFATSLDGMPLSSSSPLDPPMTDFSQRVSYRGFDITSHFAGSNKGKAHTLGIILGSGWWDPRLLGARIVKLGLLPRGPLTTVAELHLTFSDGTSAVKSPSGEQSWQMAKGFMRDSDLFTGDTIDLGTLKAMKDWDMPSGWSPASKDTTASGGVAWVNPVPFQSDITREEWREGLARRAVAQERVSGRKFAIAPVGKLFPLEAPPVLPIERIAPESVVNLGSGRWLYDFGKGMSGVLRFDDGLPSPIVPEKGYPRAHSLATADGRKEDFITVVYGDSLDMETGDINRVLVAGFGFHDGGSRKTDPNYDTASKAGPCFPRDHDNILTQRDVYVVPKNSGGSFADARQSLFTTHGFRFAEVCCTETPPKNVHAVMYRTAFQEWGRFDSSNVLLNGAYELTRNALNSNMVGTQTDCPHREKLQYGGDLNADSPPAMHFFDLGGFYTKVIHDWTDTQWNNGAYTETAIWQNLNEERGIGHGAGETVWASAPAVLTVRHVQHYGDMKLVEDTFDHHIEWLEFLKAHWEQGMAKLFYNTAGKDLKNYEGSKGGLGDWLALRTKDTWLTHHAFYMASARAVAYMAERLGSGKNDQGRSALVLADQIKDTINALYSLKGTFRMKPNADMTPGPELGLFARIVPPETRCVVTKDWLRIAGGTTPTSWSGAEETLYFEHMKKDDLEELIKLGRVKRTDVGNGKEKLRTLWKRRYNTPEGILAIRYNLKALSDFGFHNIALSKVAGVGYPSFEYMLSFNATTMWESWWRSEDVYSRDHPMLGAVAEFLSSSVAGVSLAPTTVGGKELLFWPRIPTNARIVQYASATQGTKRGDASIAWQFVGLPQDKNMYDSASVDVHIRILVPPGSSSTLRMPPSAKGENIRVKYAEAMPDFDKARSSAAAQCAKRRKAGKGFDYNWEYDPKTTEWTKVYNGKAIGTPCKSYLFDSNLDQTVWSQPEPVITKTTRATGMELSLDPGFYDVVLKKWQLEKELEDKPGYEKYTGDLGPYCSDPSTATWDVNDATHMI